MTDRELLELAAKAAGFGAPDTGGTCWTESEYPRGSGQHGTLWNYVGYMDAAQLWNPLADDGDALRLAVKLSIGLVSMKGPAGMRTNEKPYVSAFDPFGLIDIRVDHGDDPLKAMRQAIVRAAAQIGRSMP